MNKREKETMITIKIMSVISAIVVVGMMMASPSSAGVYAQFQQPQPQPQPQQQQQQQQQQQGEVFESEEDGFSLVVPQGWVIDDFDNQPLEPHGEAIAVICPENVSLPAIGGANSCIGANLTDAIYINRYPDLQSMPGFADAGIIPTTDDLVALWVDRLLYSNQSSDVQIVNSTDVNEFTKIVTATYTFYDDAGTGFNPFDDATYQNENLIMFTLSPDRNAGYLITNPMAIPNIYNQTEHSPAVQEVFNTFQVVS